MTDKRHGIIEQLWGNELIWANTDTYCAKILVFGSAGLKTSMQFHTTIDKSFFVNTGKFAVRWIDTTAGDVLEKIVSEGETWHNPRLHPYQIESRTDGASLTEISNFDDIDDCFKIS